MKTSVKAWGKLPDGRKAHLITLDNGSGVTAVVSDYGGILQSIATPDRTGVPGDVVLGYDTLEEYVRDGLFFGATVGRVANRIGGAKVTLSGRTWPLTANENGSTLHGGGGFHKKLWAFQVTEDGVELCRTSPHLEDGFPGELQVTVRFTLSPEGRLRMDYEAVSDRDTVCGLTNHSYFNLARAGTVDRHLLQVNAETYAPAGEDLLPTGELAAVKGTEYDFRALRPMGSAPLDRNLAVEPGGYAARAVEPESGRTLEVWTDLPGVQLYNGAGIPHGAGKGGFPFGSRSGFCLEAQFFPDAMNHPGFPAPFLRAGEPYRHFIEYRFGVDGGRGQ